MDKHDKHDSRTSKEFKLLNQVWDSSDPLTELKEQILTHATHPVTDDDLAIAETQYKRSVYDEQAKFDYSVAMVSSKRASIIERGIQNLKVVYGSLQRQAALEPQNADKSITQGALYYISFAYFRLRQFPLAITYGETLLHENPNHVHAQALVQLCKEMQAYPKVFASIFKNKSGDDKPVLSPRRSYSSKDGQKKDKEDGHSKSAAKEKKKQEKVLRKLEEEKYKEQLEQRKKDEKEQRKEDQRRKQLEKQRQKREAKGLGWVDELADELSDDSPRGAGSSNLHSPTVGSSPAVLAAPPTPITVVTTSPSKSKLRKSQKPLKVKKSKKKIPPPPPPPPMSAATIELLDDARNLNDLLMKKLDERREAQLQKKELALLEKESRLSKLEHKLETIEQNIYKPPENPSERSFLDDLITKNSGFSQTVPSSSTYYDDDITRILAGDVEVVPSSFADLSRDLNEFQSTMSDVFGIDGEIGDVEDMGGDEYYLPDAYGILVPTRRLGDIDTSSINAVLEPTMIAPTAIVQSVIDDIIPIFDRDNDQQKPDEDSIPEPPPLPPMLTGDVDTEAPTEQATKNEIFHMYHGQRMTVDQMIEALANESEEVEEIPNAPESDIIEEESILEEGFHEEDGYVVEYEHADDNVIDQDIDQECLSPDEKRPEFEELTKPFEDDNDPISSGDLPVEPTTVKAPEAEPDLSSISSISLPPLPAIPLSFPSVPAPKERPWAVIRRFNKRGGKKIQVPESIAELKAIASEKFGIDVVNIREIDTEAEVDNVDAIKADSVIWVLTADEESEFE